MAQSPWWIPLIIPLLPETLPCSGVLLTYLESLLSVWCDPCPLWSQVACKLTSPLLFPSPFPFPAPNDSPFQLCAFQHFESQKFLEQYASTKRLGLIWPNPWVIGLNTNGGKLNFHVTWRGLTSRVSSLTVLKNGCQWFCCKYVTVL